MRRLLAAIALMIVSPQAHAQLSPPIPNQESARAWLAGAGERWRGINEIAANEMPREIDFWLAGTSPSDELRANAVAAHAQTEAAIASMRSRIVAAGRAPPDAAFAGQDGALADDLLRSVSELQNRALAELAAWNETISEMRLAIIAGETDEWVGRRALMFTVMRARWRVLGPALEFARLDFLSESWGSGVVHLLALDARAVAAEYGARAAALRGRVDDMESAQAEAVAVAAEMVRAAQDLRGADADLRTNAPMLGLLPEAEQERVARFREIAPRFPEITHDYAISLRDRARSWGELTEQQVMDGEYAFPSLTERLFDALNAPRPPI